MGAIGVTSTEAFLIGDIEDLRGATVIESGFVLSSIENTEGTLQLESPNTFIGYADCCFS